MDHFDPEWFPSCLQARLERVDRSTDETWTTSSSPREKENPKREADPKALNHSFPFVTLLRVSGV